MAGLLAVGTVAVLGFAAAALAAGGAAGSFSNQGVTLKVVDAYAYPRPASMGDDEVFALRLSSKPINRAPLDAALDPEALLEAQLADVPGVTLEFGKDGAWQGMSYSLGSGNGCGWCSYGDMGDVVQVRVEGGALRGVMKVVPASYSDGKGPAIDLKLDVKLAAPPAATSLPAGGGDPGKAMTGCLTAVQKKDPEAFKRHCAEADVAKLANAEASGSLEGFWDYGLYGRDALKLKTSTVKGGRATTDQAELLVEGKSDDGKYRGKVYLRKVGGAWRFDHDKLKQVWE
jgi:hypothetical protein